LFGGQTSVVHWPVFILETTKELRKFLNDRFWPKAAPRLLK
jgi:hypothetical protein